jgi:hypothetical protein
MIKQIKYISRFARPMTAADIEALAEAAARKNAELGVTGVLLAAGGVFFQILEGPKEAVDRLFETIVADRRHEQVLLLGSREGVESRVFDNWAMGKVDLDASADQRLESLKALLSAVFEQRRLMDGLVGALERGAWHELADART